MIDWEKLIREVIEDLGEKEVENTEIFEDDGDIYRAGKADAFNEAIGMLKRIASCVWSVTVR